MGMASLFDVLTSNGIQQRGNCNAERGARPFQDL
jgi:hypothetical protein